MAALKKMAETGELEKALVAMVDQSRAQAEADGERLMALLEKYGDRVGGPVVSTYNGEVHVHPDLARELDKPGNEELREMVANFKFARTPETSHGSSSGKPQERD